MYYLFEILYNTSDTTNKFIRIYSSFKTFIIDDKNRKITFSEYKPNSINDTCINNYNKGCIILDQENDKNVSLPENTVRCFILVLCENDIHQTQEIVVCEEIVIEENNIIFKDNSLFLHITDKNLLKNNSIHNIIYDATTQQHLELNDIHLDELPGLDGNQILINQLKEVSIKALLDILSKKKEKI